MPLFALVDCNNFYASCERIFAPRLANQPVLILSNNDGCIVARSNEVKKLGIPMGAPFFEWRDFCRKHNVTVLSSNYELYGDISSRVMRLLEQFCPEIEFYSIDEAFLRLEGFDTTHLIQHVTALRRTVLRCTGIPVSIGIAPTKTLAKVANQVAKKTTSSGVCDLQKPLTQDEILATFPVGDLWGIGRRLAIRLEKHNILTARQLRDCHAPTFRKSFGVAMERIIFELRGIACHGLDTFTARKQIISSRSFGAPVFSLSDLEEAVSHYTAIACQKLRSQKSLASVIHVFIHTSPFARNGQAYANTSTCVLPIPASDTGRIIRAAKQCLSAIYRPRLQYKKTGIMLDGLSPAENQQNTLFPESSDNRRQILMATVDNINRIMGKKTVCFLAEGIAQDWKNKRGHCSPGYTTHWEEIPVVYC